MEKYQMLLLPAGLLCATILLSKYFIVPLFVQMSIYSASIIYIGAHYSILRMFSDEESDLLSNSNDTIDKWDVLLFPIVGSALLMILYLMYTYFDNTWVDFALKLYTGQFAAFAMYDIIHFTLKRRSSKKYSPLFEFDLSFLKGKSRKEPWKFGMELKAILCAITAAAVALIWFFTESWLLHNVLAICICVEALSLSSLGKFSLASLMLGTLFIYDIFWVFGTNVMVTVAKSFGGPAKLIFPYSHHPLSFSILGLGDIILPGFFISMCLRFDYCLHHRNLDPANTASGNYVDQTGMPVACNDKIKTTITKIEVDAKFSKFYFWVVLFFYQIGLITTQLVMHFFKHAQPALLYLVPYCVFSLYGAAVLNGQIRDVAEYDEGAASSGDEAPSENIHKKSD